MITNIISIFFCLVSTIFSCFLLKRFVLALQLGEYKNKAYFEFIKESFNKYFKYILIVFFALSFIAVVFHFFLANFINFIILFSMFVGLYILLSYCLIAKFNKLEQKVKLNYTARLKRLLIFYFCLDFITNFSLTFFVLNGFKYISYFNLIYYLIILPLANIIILPVENLIKFKFIRKAKIILKNSKDLIKIGITGSFGKTSTKFILASFLSIKYNVCFTPKSYNTLMGISKVVINDLKPYHNVLIAEMGANTKNDIKKLCDLVNPNYGIITAVGKSHLKTFKSFQNLKNTKYQLVEAVERCGGFMVFNGCNKWCTEFYNNAKCEKMVVNIDKKCDIYAKNIKYFQNCTYFTLVINSKEYNCSTKLLGLGYLEDILLAVALALKLGISIYAILYKLKELKPVEHRLELIKKNNYFVLDDSFNSNLKGAINALEVLKSFKGKRIVVTPGIVELGKDALKYNTILGRCISKCADICIVVNKVNANAITDGINNKIKTYYADDFKSAMQVLDIIKEENDCILFENDLPDNYI